MLSQRWCLFKEWISLFLMAIFAVMNVHSPHKHVKSLCMYQNVAIIQLGMPEICLIFSAYNHKNWAHVSFGIVILQMCKAGCLKPCLHWCEILLSPRLLKMKGFWVSQASSFSTEELGNSFSNMLVKRSNTTSLFFHCHCNMRVIVSPDRTGNLCNDSAWRETQGLRGFWFPLLETPVCVLVATISPQNMLSHTPVWCRRQK